MNFNNILIGSADPQRLADYYTKLFGKPAFEDSGYSGWQIGSGFVSVGPHSEVTGENTQPGRLIWNIETTDVRGEFDRMKAAGAIVVREPYEFEGMPGLSDRDARRPGQQLLPADDPVRIRGHDRQLVGAPPQSDPPTEVPPSGTAPESGASTVGRRDPATHHSGHASSVGPHRRRPRRLPWRSPGCPGAVRIRRGRRSRRWRGRAPAAARFEPEVVVLDVQLPGINGFEVSRRLLATPRPPVVVLVSTAEAADYGRRIGESGAVGFITKSNLSGDTLHAILRGETEGVS